MSISVGDIVEGKVTGITKFGAFVECEDGTKGLVHISQISNDYIEKVEDVLKVNDVVKCKVMSIEDKKVSFSIKECLPKKEHKKEFTKKTYSDDSNVDKDSNKESTFDDLLTKFMKESNERLDSIRQRENKKFSKKRKYN
ncbi:S1 RNA-binding domain-containing protein [Finegoldia magna]|uniref:S1 RNA-binding domain-containing protein n=1 Tax=Finegoldia magna TaxID=1260 RepID=UPI0025CF004D|nr:S1 RNA-binding domain-containing protein [Finegoldia magna]MBS5777315.1 S1 RNA-binding domain-containing protein [Finegoldia magna]MDU1832937.1 S1 RNA-binding domain-containing protein [Finegoldia magna]MDU2575332.1 S1 RNA-binding domain-containing protein [Finegoldia magna]MDU5069773.1 S1 RNA-binding domain-containing protein [Finegoldia magna]MDU7478475.1 S1 RNA-binding domain-containing protein [Finegoldia magna]